MTITALAIGLGLAAILVGGTWLVWYMGNRRYKIRRALTNFCKGRG